MRSGASGAVGRSGASGAVWGAVAHAAQGGEPAGSSGSSILVLGVGFVLSVAVFALVFGGKKTAAVATKGVKGKK